jgi:predicted transposase/invertase (TIGR01784 family)
MLFTDWNWADAKEVWHEEGVAEGVEKGRKEACQENARRFKALGLSDEQIAIGTGLSLEEIAVL